MSTVTLRGTITPSTHLATGETMTVERTPLVDKWISGGFVEIVEDEPVSEPTGDPAATSAETPADTVTPPPAKAKTARTTRTGSDGDTE